MGIALPQLAPASEDRVSGAQVIDGGLNFNKSVSTHLTKTPGSAGNRKKWTWSGWIKALESSATMHILAAGTASTDRLSLYISASAPTGRIKLSERVSNSSTDILASTQLQRDPSGWYHIVLRWDTTISSPADDRVRLYVNGTQVTAFDTRNNPNQNHESFIGNNVQHKIGYNLDSTYLNAIQSQCYFVDGLALGPENFGFSDPLTNTWRPKKYEGDFNYAATSGTLLNYNSNTSLPTYSDQDSNSGTPSVYQMENAFDGDSSTYANMTYSNGKWTRANFAQPITNVTRIDIGWDGEGDVGYNGSVVNSSVGYNGSRQSLTLYNNSGSPITLNNIHMVSQPGNGVCRLYDITITTTSQSATELTFTEGTGTNSFYLPMDGNTPIGKDQSGVGNDWTPKNFGGSTDITKATGALPILNTVNGGTVARSGVFGSDVSSSYATTSASNSGGKYVFEGLGTQPTFNFVRGATYIFDWSASSGHPLRFATAADAAGSTEYTNGTNVSGNVTKITVPHNAPDTLYYYCNVHNGMGNSISVTTDETKADPYAWKCTLALPCIGTSDDVSHLINCTTSELPIVDQGNAHADYLRGNFYGGSYDLDNSGDYINVNSSSPYSHVNFGTGDYTAECWVYLEGTGDEYVFNMATNHGGAAPHWNINFYGTNLIRAGRTNGSGDSKHQVTTSFATNKWMHIAVSRGSGTSRLFLDGVLIDTQSDTDNIVPTGNLNIGAYNNGGNELNGFVQDARIYNGVAKYTSSFIPASTSPDIFPDTPSGVATKSKLKKITDGAIAFDGSGDYLVAGDNADFAMGTGDFTLECFVYRDSSVSAFTNFIATRGSAGSANGYTFGAQASSNGYDVEFYTDAMSGINGGNQKITPNRWHHVVLTRSGSTLRSFVNGILNTTASNSQNFSNTSMAIGMTNDGSQGPMNGFLSNVRVIKGSIPTEYQTSSTTVDTKIFTPPTQPLTAVTNTKLLCCQSPTSTNAAAVSPSGTTVFSEAVTAGSEFRSGYGPENAFNGTVTNNYNETTAVQINQTGFVEFDFGDGVAFTTLQLQLDDNNVGTVVLTGANGAVDITSQLPTGSFTNTTITGVTSPLKKLRMNKTTSDASSLYLKSITIDGVMLKDPVVKKADAAATTFNPLNTDINTVRGQEGIYCTLNPLAKSSNFVITNGNLSIGNAGSTGACLGTIPYPRTGKWYYEIIFGSVPGYNHVGVAREDTGLTGNPGYDSNKQFTYWQNGSKTNNASYAATYAAGDVIGCAFDADAGRLYFYKNGISQGLNSNALTSTEYRYFPYFPCYTFTAEVNFGQKPFRFLPSGYQALTSSIIRPDTVITRPHVYNGPLKYTGKAGGSQQDQDKIAFTPDLVWVKRRNAAEQNKIYDTVRGASGGNFYHIESNNNSASATESGAITQMLPGGFYATGGGHVNSAGEPFIAWMWRAGGGTTTGSAGNQFWKDGIQYASAAAAGLNGGTLTPTASSVGTKQGFSILKWNSGGSSGNYTLSHGLGREPQFIIQRALDGANTWVYHASQVLTDYRKHLQLNSNAGDQTNSANFWGASGHTDSLYGVRVGDLIGTSKDAIAYLWADVPGLQKFGKYTANGDGSGGGDEDGPFVELGFKPAMILFKGSHTSDWTWIDQERCTVNYNDVALRANYHYGEIGNARGGVGSSSQPENYAVDLLSNGFKIRASGGSLNGGTNIIYYAAWAEAPSFTLYGASADAK